MHRKIAIFGGSFDPPHFGHVLVLDQILNSDLVSELWLVPAGDDRYDKGSRCFGPQRVVMLRCLWECELKKDPRIRIETAQVDGALPGSSAFELLEYCRSRDPEAEFYFVIGSDNVADLPNWRYAAELQSKYGFLVIPRLGVAAAAPHNARLLFLDRSPLLANNYSSRAVRELLQRGAAVAGVVPLSVRDYIRREGLYA